MKTERLLAEIHEINVAFLSLARAMLREDRAKASRLGVSEPVADMLVLLSPAQMLKIAASNLLMCRFRFDDRLVWDLVTSHSDGRDLSTAHAAAALINRSSEAI